MTSRSVDISQWDRYWAYGNIHSFSQVSGGNYEGAVAEFWKSRFECLANGCHVVDVATGNGAVALLALEVSAAKARHLRISGTDLADIDPAHRVADTSLVDQLKRIEFHGRTPAESLPFDDASVDMVCSQFGLEYSDVSESVAEIARVLRPGGSLVVIAHHNESILLAAARRELDDLRFVMDDVKLYLRARNLLRAMADSPAAGKGGGGSASAKLEKKRRALQAAMERVQQAAGRSDNPAMLVGPARYIREIFTMEGRSSPLELQKWLEEAQRRVAANRQRLTDMTGAARSDADVQEIRNNLNDCGFSDIDVGLFRTADAFLLGWRIEARMPA